MNFVALKSLPMFACTKIGLDILKGKNINKPLAPK